MILVMLYHRGTHSQATQGSIGGCSWCTPEVIVLVGYTVPTHPDTPHPTLYTPGLLESQLMPPSEFREDSPNTTATHI